MDTKYEINISIIFMFLHLVWLVISKNDECKDTWCDINWLISSFWNCEILFIIIDF